MKPNKKKPRIRNRPRNKANRQNLVESENTEEPSTSGFKANNDVSSEDEDDEMPGLEDECDTKKYKLFYYIPEEDESIKRIQKFMSDRNLKHQLMFGTTETDTISETQNPMINQVTQPVTNVDSVDTHSKRLETSRTTVADDKVTESVAPDSEKVAKDKTEKMQPPTKAKKVLNVVETINTKPTISTTTTTQQKETTAAKTNKNETDVNVIHPPDTCAQAATKRSNKIKEKSKESKSNASAIQNSSKPKGKPGDNNNPDKIPKAMVMTSATANPTTTTAPTTSTTSAISTSTTSTIPTPTTTQQKETSAAKTNKNETDVNGCAHLGASGQAATKRSNKSKEYSKETISNASGTKNSFKPKGNTGDSNNAEQSAFIQNIQKKMEAMMASGDETLPNNLMENLKKLFDQGPVSDIESDDDGDEYVEYVYKPRKYFVVALCNLCKCDLTQLPHSIECSKCHMTYYCSVEHMQNDAEHRQLCSALQQVAASEDGHIFQKCADMSADQFRSYRIITIRKVETRLHRPLTATEQEVILFPHMCVKATCRQYQFDALKNCPHCGMVAYCAQQPEHLADDHVKWCASYQLFKEFIIFQEQFGRLDPSLPTKILRDTPLNCNTTKQIFCKLGFDLPFNCEYAALTQISTGPLTAWYTLKLCEQLCSHQDLTIHLIGAEIEFEVDVLHKWELFFLHITPAVKNLNVVFVGPELNPNNILLEQFQKTKCCIGCRKNNRSVKYFFESRTYHDYSRSKNFSTPTLICFFNAGLYRSTGYNMEDTWPETIVAASKLNVPIVVTAYTEYESPLDLQRFVEEVPRKLKVIQNPLENPFASLKPERNFISDHEAPLMFKNSFFFVIE